MVRSRVRSSDVIGALGLAVIAAGIALIIDGARMSPAPVTGPPQVWAGFLVGLVGMAITASGMMRKR